MPAAVGRIGSGPFGQLGQQVFRPVERDEQVVLHQPPVEGRRGIFVVLAFVCLHHLLIGQLEESLGILRLGALVSGEVGEHGDKSRLRGQVQQVS